jgi:hypothetical protein
MATDVRAVLIGEGPSDLALAPHLQRLCVEFGAAEAVCRAPDLSRCASHVGHDVGQKAQAALALHPDTNLVFAHRDADARDGTARNAEITHALRNMERPWVAVVPVQELEAWLLLDESAIRCAVGRTRGRARLHLPTAPRVEDVARPKEALRTAIQTAQEGVARRRRVSFERARRYLLANLDIDGPIRQVASFQRLTEDIHETLKRLP